MTEPLLKSHIDQLVRPAIRRLVPYASARSQRPTQAGTPRIQLDANEWGGEGGVSGYERYPDPQPSILRQAYAQHLGVPTERLFLSRGADEAIEVLLRTFCDADDDAILVTPPTYGYYEVAAAIQGAGVVKVPLAGDDFDLDDDGILRAVTTGVKLVFVCSPNNPTGNGFEPERLLRLAQRIEGKALLVVDEAYGEFTTRKSLASFAPGCENLVVLRTLSKAFGHAGIRVGAAVADSSIITWMQKVRAPYPLSRPQVEAAVQALATYGGASLAPRREFIAGERERMTQRLRGLSLVKKVWPSEANFLLVRIRQAELVLAHLESRGILIRDRSGELGLADCVRISIGNRRENDTLLAALQTIAEVS